MAQNLTPATVTDVDYAGNAVYVWLDGAHDWQHAVDSAEHETGTAYAGVREVEVTDGMTLVTFDRH